MATQSIKIITPHLGELSKLLSIEGGGEGGSGSGRDLARLEPLLLINECFQFVDKYQCILVVKGCRTLIICPGGKLFININGNSGLATAGTGDVLCGIIAACLCHYRIKSFSNIIDVWKAVAAAVYIHGLAADEGVVNENWGEDGLTATKLLNMVGVAMKKLRGK